jgi:hypothetical protein
MVMIIITYKILRSFYYKTADLFEHFIHMAINIWNLRNFRGAKLLPRFFILFYFFFTFMWPCIVTNFFVIKPTRCTNFTNLFCHETLHVSDSSSVHHQEFIHCTLSNGTCHTAFEQDQNGTPVPSWSCSKAV